jgi:hypothetical protein
MILLVIFIILLILFCYFFIGKPKPAEKITWGVNFSQKHAENLGLDWKETYLALLDDLKVKNVKLITNWDKLEPEPNKYNFDDLDWQVQKAEERGVKILLVIGMKTGRWPECFIPDWAQNLGEREQQERISDLIEKIVLRYRNSDSIVMWQVENEPFFPFGRCPWTDEEFLKKEVALVKSEDTQKRPVLISDSGEDSFWVEAAKVGDVVGITMYKKVWYNLSFTKIKLPFLSKDAGFYLQFPYPPTFYSRKAFYINKIFGKKVMVVELQAEPWGPKLLYDSPLSEQEKTMNLEKFKYNIEFAGKTGLDTFYLWGGEWWYWMKEKQNNSQIWEEARKLF